MLELNPHDVIPTPGRCVIKREKPPEKRGKLFLPSNGKGHASTFEGVVLSINEARGGDAQDVLPGDRVFFSCFIGEDDSRFINWGGDEYVLIPTEAIQAVAG